ncbi:MAG: sigma-70 family RNA polymerase sigma factor [Bacteroidetes bacterium]|nr:MAG: sigma-70 family RNA polymerase sigma factor [Bacteroidota bacterium]
MKLLRIEKKREHTDDLELALACARGDKSAMDHVYRNYGGKILSICRRYTANRDEAEDCLHDGFIKVFEKIGNYSGKGGLYAWVKTVIVNQTINTLKARHSMLELSPLEEVPNEEDEVLPPQAEPEKVIHCISQLPPGYRMVLNMYVFEQMSHDQIAEQLGISPNTSRTQLHKARLRLKELIK